MHLLYGVTQAHDKLSAMNDPAKGGSEYLQQRISNARDSLVAAPETPSSEAPKEGQ